LSAIPRVALGRFPTPIEPLAALSPTLWIKRDDLGATLLGGNKLRALEFLLAGVGPAWAEAAEAPRAIAQAARRRFTLFEMLETCWAYVK